MRKLIILALLCAPMWGACSNTDFGNGFTCIQAGITSNAGVGATATVTFGVATTAGNTVVVYGFLCANGPCSSSTTGLALTAENGATDTPVEVTGGPFYMAGNVRKFSAWVFSNVSATTTFTVRCDGTCSYVTIAASEWSGVRSASPFDVVAAASAASGATSATITTDATTFATDLVVGWVFGASSVTAGDGFTEIGKTGNNQHEAKSVTSTGAQSCTQSWSTSGAYTGICLALKGPAASGRRRVVLIQ